MNSSEKSKKHTRQNKHKKQSTDIFSQVLIAIGASSALILVSLLIYLSLNK